MMVVWHRVSELPWNDPYDALQCFFQHVTWKNMKVSTLLLSLLVMLHLGRYKRLCNVARMSFAVWKNK
jgi:hypothetical protein